MSLREKFLEISDKLDDRKWAKAIKKDAQRKERLNKKVEELAESLPEKIRKTLEKNPDQEFMTFRFNEPDVYGTMKEFPGYRRLHEMCKAENVGVNLFEISGYRQIQVFPQKAYNTSPDADFLEPKKPKPEQLKLF